MNTEIVSTSALLIGDVVTEVDTPQGPFYTVVRGTTKSVWIEANELSFGIQTRISRRDNAIIRRVIK